MPGGGGKGRGWPGRGNGGVIKGEGPPEKEFGGRSAGCSGWAAEGGGLW